MVFCFVWYILEIHTSITAGEARKVSGELGKGGRLCGGDGCDCLGTFAVFSDLLEPGSFLFLFEAF